MLSQVHGPNASSGTSRNTDQRINLRVFLLALRSAVAERLRDASCHYIAESKPLKSFEMTPFSRA